MNTDAVDQFEVTGQAEFVIELIACCEHFQGCIQGCLLFVCKGNGMAEHCHDLVADEFIDHAATGFNDFDHGCEILIQQAHKHGGGQVFAHRGKSSEITKENRYSDDLAFA